ncbi:MAG: UDP-N-acetylmuramoyl-L-alanine--D-glutamate ligase [Elusimicrobia bacterium]|nr:UDP-N-acetylmuramoyl-L-alanine--D-glutamate ligase [Elusimicrobiota bacterium]
MFDYAILGLGKTGRAVLEYLDKNEPKADVLASEAKTDPALEIKLRDDFPGVVFESGGHTEKVLQAKLIIKSPGLDPKIPILSKIRQSGIKVVSELEFALLKLKERPKTIIAVTGTNGKTTTTHLIGHLLAMNNRKTVVAGNIGSPLISQIPNIGKQTDLALEISSYQLEDSGYLNLDCAALMNITPDHLDHHGGWDSYVAAKGKIFSSLRPSGIGIVNWQDKAGQELSSGFKVKRLFFSSRQVLKQGAWSRDGKIYFCASELGCPLAESIAPCPNLMGDHNLENQMAAALAALFAGLRLPEIETALKTYFPPAHRLEKLGEVKGVLFINDSKATNVESVLVALAALEPVARARHGKIHLLLGGLDKGSSYAPIAAYAPIVTAVYCFGQAKVKIAADLAAKLAHRTHENMAEAGRDALGRASKGDIILLSPACASFDQFQNFEHRGDSFREFFRSLALIKT